jgi:hypothetical protein
MEDASSLLFSLEWQYSQYELHIHDLGVNIGILSRVPFTFLVILFLVLMQTGIRGVGKTNHICQRNPR